MSKRPLFYPLAMCILFAGLYSYGYFFPSSLNWGFHFLGFLPSYTFIVFLAGVGLLLVYILKGDGGQMLDTFSSFMEKHPVVFLISVCIAFVVIALSLRVSIPLLGDSFILLNNFEYTFKGDHPLYLHRSPLAFAFFYACASLLDTPIYPDIMNAFLAGELFLGVGFIVCVFFITRTLFEERNERLLSFCLLVILPYMQLFFGYAELYSVVLFSLSLYALVSILHVQRKASFIFLPSAYFLLYAANYLNIIILPALLYSTYLEYKQGAKWTIPVGFLLLGLALLGILAAMNFEVERFFMAAEHSHWLSLSYDAGDQFQAYSLFSPYHGIDLLNIFLLHGAGVICIFSLIALPRTTIYLEGSSKNSSSTVIPAGYKRESPPNGSRFPIKNFGNDTSGVVRTTLDILDGFFLSAFTLFIGFILIVKFDLGFPKDWDVPAPYFFLLHLLALKLFFQAKHRERFKVIAVIIMMTLLSSFSWFMVNSSTDASLHRAKTIIDERITPPSGVYQSMFHISLYYHHNRMFNEQIDIWKRYTESQPRDWRGLQNLAKSYYLAGATYDSLAANAFERWITVDSLQGRGKIEYANFLSERGFTMYQQRLFAVAERQFRKAIEYNPELMAVYSNLASLYIDSSLPDSAINVCRRAIHINPGYTLAYQNIATAYGQRNEPDSAILYYKKVIAMEPTNHIAYENMSRAYYQKGDKAGAMDVLREAARLGSQTARKLLSMSGERW